MKRALATLALSTLLIAATPTPFGGWAVVTVLDMPEYLEAGKATTLAFEIRRHGAVLLDDVSPTVTLRRPDAGFVSRMLERDRFGAERREGSAVYRATITPRDTGEVLITIDTDWNRWKVDLLPISVVASGERPEPMSPTDRGRQLFVAKGCAGCHVKRDDPVLAERRAVPVGPELTGREYPPDWLAQKIADPARLRGSSNRYGSDYGQMPNLGLDEEEIAAIVSFINEERVAAVEMEGW